MTETSGSRTALPLAAGRRAFYLAPHPATPCEAVRSIVARVSSRGGGALELTYEIEGDPARVCLPEPAPPRRADGLWRHTCFEAFIAREGAAPLGPYVELNFSPSGEWAGYVFDGYRSGMKPLDIAAPAIALERDAGGVRWTVRAQANVGPFAGAGARLALAAVIEDTDGRCAYWALRHPSGRPDFHHPAGFTEIVS